MLYKTRITISETKYIIVDGILEDNDFIAVREFRGHFPNGPLNTVYKLVSAISEYLVARGFKIIAVDTYELQHIDLVKEFE